ncbi:hypothetical protein DW1_1140 [Proteiniborus sp. DW1]|uniref:hypothetical protein n=1 Tax=Proteiniborus sp. DW1 TaxID=1889883 RepID=UPI00092E0137|nr:hypothetical protein [Proteiniborus sp. DW1]SCG82713.1 hypothetical protein DW1_1140 [Proteiniborus sp. DW1]
MRTLNSYIAKSIIRYLNGDYGEYRSLKNKALEIHKEEQYQRRCILTIGETIPSSTKKKIYKMVN